MPDSNGNDFRQTVLSARDATPLEYRLYPGPLAGAPPKVLMLPGLGHGAEALHELACRLRERATVVVANVRGHGALTQTQAHTSQVSPFAAADVADDLAQIAISSGFDHGTGIAFDLTAPYLLSMGLAFPARFQRWVLVNVASSFAEQDVDRAMDHLVSASNFPNESAAREGIEQWLETLPASQANADDIFAMSFCEDRHGRVRRYCHDYALRSLASHKGLRARMSRLVHSVGAVPQLRVAGDVAIPFADASDVTTGEDGRNVEVITGLRSFAPWLEAEALAATITGWWTAAT